MSARVLLNPLNSLWLNILFIYDIYRNYLFFILIPFQGHDLWAASIRDRLSFISDSASLIFADDFIKIIAKVEQY